MAYWKGASHVTTRNVKRLGDIHKVNFLLRGGNENVMKYTCHILLL